MRHSLNVPPEIVRTLIERLQHIQAKEQVVVPTSPDGDEDWGAQVLADHASDPAVAELRLAVEDLEPDQQIEVVALMWVGRGDFSGEEWPEALAQARERWTPRTAEYLLTTPLAGEYLAEGLEALEYIDE